LRHLLTTALRTKLGATLLFGVRKPTTDTPAYFHCLSLHLRMQKWRGQDKFLSALPRPPAGPYAVEKLLVAQGDHRIDFRGAPRRNVTRGQRNQSEQDRNSGEGKRVGCADSVEQAGHESGQRKGSNQA
jgi:hypothetical protein